MLGLVYGGKNKFFTLKNEGENRYFIEDFNAEQTKGLNNVYLLAKEVKERSIVLDIGCAQGRFGNILKKRECTIYGVDLDPKAIEHAKGSGYYNKVFLMDITNKNSYEYKEFINIVKDVDAIIISDVLEHLSDPTGLILDCYRLLKENGVILVSVPNIAHVDILLNLMNDKFNYQDMGILDNTHLKFFTKTSFVDWITQINETFDDINFDCEYLGATFCNSQFLNTIKKNYKELFTILENSPNYNGLQILFKLTKLSEEQVSFNLKELQEENKTDVVEILGNALKGKINNIQNHKLVEGERIWYEETLNWHKNKVYELEKAIEWHHENDKNMEYIAKEKDKSIKEQQESLQWHRDKVQELERAIEWHHENDENMEFVVREKDKSIKEQQESLQWHMDKVQELERSIEWHHENDENIEHVIKEKDNYIKEQKESLQWHIDRVKELEKAIEWHHENDKNIEHVIKEKDNYLNEQQKSLQWHMDKVKELQKAIDWHHENDIATEILIKERESEFVNIRNKDKQEILELRKQIFELENSRSWRWTKFLRKNK